MTNGTSSVFQRKKCVTTALALFFRASLFSFHSLTIATSPQHQLSASTHHAERDPPQPRGQGCHQAGLAYHNSGKSNVFFAHGSYSAAKCFVLKSMSLNLFFFSPFNEQKIITATVARLYVAYPDPNSWTYSGIMGGLAFVQTKGTFLFRIVDLMVNMIFLYSTLQKKRYTCALLFA